MTAPLGTAARLAALEAEVAGQQEQIRVLSEQFAAIMDAFAAMGRYAGVSLPVPRRLRALPDSGGAAPGGHGSTR